MLETIREACAGNGQSTAPSQAVPGEDNSSSPNTDKVIVDLEDA